MLKNNPNFRGYFKCEENDREFCLDAQHYETLCETCRFYEETHGIPTCCGNEYEKKAIIHDLKIDPIYFDAVKDGKKQFEIRKDDRNYQVGDLITLREWNMGGYTGRVIENIPIRYILRDVYGYGLQKGYCILGL